MSLDDFMAWREPLALDWRDQVRAVLDKLQIDGAKDAALSGKIRRLAAMRAGDRERLVLARLAKVAQKAPSALPQFRPLRVLLVSNRTLTFFADHLAASGLSRGLLIEAVETEYDSTAVLALDPAFPVPVGRFDAVFLLLDPDWISASAPLLDQTAEAADCERMSAQISAIVEGLKARIGAPVIAATIAARPEDQLSVADRAMPATRLRFIDGCNAALWDLSECGKAVLFDLAALAAAIGGNAFHDPALLAIAKVPFSMETSPVVADRLTALLAAMFGKSGRAIVFDLDNTLWGGNIADDGIEGIELGQGSALGEAFLAMQEFALELRRRGFAIAVCSKNLEASARQPFREHAEMRLRESDIAAFIANFDDKASNLARIAATLDLDPSSLVFIDDNPAERERVRAALPLVLVPEVGEDPVFYRRHILNSGFVEHPPLTIDDTMRADAYHGRATAKALAASVQDYDSYLASLDMKLSIAPFDAAGRARIANLLQKSNQFNLTTRRYSEAEVEAIERDPGKLALQIRLKDRFADHGMISVVIVDTQGDVWEIDTWLMSCRVLERRVEYGIMNYIMDQARSREAKQIFGHYIPTARNALVADFYERMRFEPAGAETVERSAGELYFAKPDSWICPMKLHFFGAPEMAAV
jgi:FkbH-like protein